MAKSNEIVIKEADPKAPRNVFPLIPNFKFEFPFFSNFKFELPFLKPDPTKAKAPRKEEERRTAVVDDKGNGNESLKPNFVRFPKSQLVVPQPLETEAEESTKTSNPIILWQVYALGGILMLRWAWARWNERKAKGRSPKDESAQRRPSDDGRSPDNEE